MFAGGREFVDASSTLRSLAERLARAQADLDREILASAEAMKKADEMGFSLETNTWVRLRDQPRGQVLPLSSMVPHRRYQIDRLAIELAVIPEPGVAPDAIAPGTRLRLVGLDSAEAGACPARITLRRAQGIVAELEVAGRTAARVVRDDPDPS